MDDSETDEEREVERFLKDENLIRHSKDISQGILIANGYAVVHLAFFVISSCIYLSIERPLRPELVERSEYSLYSLASENILGQGGVIECYTVNSTGQYDSYSENFYVKAHVDDAMPSLIMMHFLCFIALFVGNICKYKCARLYCHNILLILTILLYLMSVLHMFIELGKTTFNQHGKLTEFTKVLPANSTLKLENNKFRCPLS